MESLEFYKMSGHGNDFIIVDNWDQQVAPDKMPDLARAVCRRRTSVGADGMVFVEEGPADVDFAWRFFNSDGSEAEMCGNAGRCVARFAYLTGIATAEMSFMTQAGIIRAKVKDNIVKVQMTPAGEPRMDVHLDLDGSKVTLGTMNIGVPHAVVWIDDIEAAPVVELGRALRYHGHFAPAGTNVNFVKIMEPGLLAVRTYERGVEDETLACGTGSIASTLLSSLKEKIDSPTRILTRGGEELLIHFKNDGETFGDVYMEGRVRLVYTGQLGPDAAS
jgi:diaminopimelate epimerase